MPIDRIGNVSIFCTDQDRARDFYTRVLGMELLSDAPLYPGAQARWLSVVPPGAETRITLYLLDDNWAHYRPVLGQSQALTLEVSSLAETYDELRARGVTFVQEPVTEPWGSYAIIEDSEGNRLIVAEPARELADVPPPTTTELLRRIDRAHRALEQVVAPLSEKQLSTRGPSGWAVKDHLSHLATWELGIVELLHRRPRFEAMGVADAQSNGKSMDEINELIYRRRANRTAADTLEYFADVHQQMLDVLRSMDDQDLGRPYSSFLPEGASGPDDPVVRWIAGNTYDHYDEHRGYIQALLDSLHQGQYKTEDRGQEEGVAPIRRTLRVALPPERAFALFAEQMDTWWPRHYTWSGDVLETIGLEPRAGGRCYERGPHGFTLDWGRVLTWIPPHELVFTWQIDPDRVPDPNPSRASEVEVRFLEAGDDNTRIEFEHRDLERHGAGAAGYRDALDAPEGWDYILGRYAAAAV